MKCLSLWNPWAYWYVSGQKKNETRSWRTNYTGPLLIHAARAFPPEARRFAETERAMQRLPGRLAFGAIIGAVTLMGCRMTEDIAQQITALERLYGDYSAGRWAWIACDPIMFKEPIPFKGRQGIFEVPDELIKGGICNNHLTSGPLLSFSAISG